MNARTRFAPSPTGFMHVGGLRTALFAWLVARQTRGQFILRIEDTDRTRHVEESEQHIQDCLKWLGLDWDEGPFRQSERLDIYKEWANKLVAAGKAYADPYSPQQLEKFRQEAIGQKKPFLFRNHRPNPPAGGPSKWDGSQPLRFKSEPKAYTWHDEVMGELSAGPGTIDDFIILKSDGFPTYNFAHIVDDHLMRITHVIRSQEFLPSVPKFLNLYEALKIEPPKLATLPYVMGPDGKKKLSKRYGAKDVLDYKKEGYLPQALINLLATLGWNDGTTQEIFSSDELIKKFSLDRVQKGGACFDEQRLNWLNGHYLRQMPSDKLYELSKDFWPRTSDNQTDAYKKRVLALIQERLKYLAEIPGLTDFFFADEPDEDKLIQLIKNDKYLKTVSLADIKNLLAKSRERLEQSDFSLEDLTKALNYLLEETRQKPGVLFGIIRIASTWVPASPELAKTLNILTKGRSLHRIDKAISALAK